VVLSVQPTIGSFVPSKVVFRKQMAGTAARPTKAAARPTGEHRAF
jgi:hypothetical protein